MASKTTLNVQNLEALGAARLAALLIEVSTGSAAAKRRLRLELAGAQSPQEAAREVAKRLASIAKSRAKVTWRSRKVLVADLEAQLHAIEVLVAPADPAEAAELCWRFMALANGVFARCDDSGGTVLEVFQRGLALLGRVAGGPPEVLAGQVLDALGENGHGQYDGVIGKLAGALGPEGLAALKAQVLALTPVPVPARAAWKVAGYGSGGVVYAHQVAERMRQRLVKVALQDIADATGDVDAFIAGHDAESLRKPLVAVEVAGRLMAAGRAAEALALIDRAEPAGMLPPPVWVSARLAALEALGRPAEAQSFRWAHFERSLAADPLRVYLKKLGDFEDVDAEDRALAHAEAFPYAEAALHFLLQWPAMDRAARMAVRRFREFDGDRHDLLTPAAEALVARHPLAATLLWRVMIDRVLGASKSGRYAHAARYLMDCAGVAALVEFGAVEPHDAYVARLKREHGKKAGFWGFLG